MPRDERYQDAGLRTADRQDAPEPGRPVPAHEREEQSGQAAKPSQAEGERETMEEKGL
jgi:hypothetical protein